MTKRTFFQQDKLQRVKSPTNSQDIRLGRALVPYTGQEWALPGMTTTGDRDKAVIVASYIDRMITRSSQHEKTNRLPGMPTPEREDQALASNSQTAPGSVLRKPGEQEQ